LNRHIGQGRRGFPEAHEPLAGKERAGTGIRASYSERGSRPRATTKQADQRGRAGSRSERKEEATSTHHRDPRAGLSRPSGQFAPRNIHLLASYDLSHLFNSGHGHQSLATRGVLPVITGSRCRDAKTTVCPTAAGTRTSSTQPTTTSVSREARS
jgi:hypothetical protein